MYLLGDIAIGEQIVGQVRCSVRGAQFPNTPPTVAQPPGTAPTTTAVRPTTSLPAATTTVPAASTTQPQTPVTEPIASDDGSGLRLILAGIVLLALVTGVWLTRGRRRARDALPHDP
jgi:cell division septation protein DedD